MTFVHGRNSAISVNGTLLTAYTDSADFGRDVDLAETSTFGVSDKTFIPGLRSGKVSMSGNYDPTITVGPAVVLEPLLGAAAFTVIYYPGGNTTGQRSHTFSALLTNYSESSSVSDKVTFKAEMTITGPVTSATI